jgi:hypothetical protein
MRKLIEPFKVAGRFISVFNDLDEWNMVCCRPIVQELALLNVLN